VQGVLDRLDKGWKPLSRSFLDNNKKYDSPSRLGSFCGTYHLFCNVSERWKFIDKPFRVRVSSTVGMAIIN